MKHGGDVWQGGAPADWLDFSANLRPEGPPGWVIAAMRGAVGEARYYPDLSMRAARKGLADYTGVPGDCILPTAGGIEAIDAVCRAGTGRVLIVQPTFGEYARRARASGRALKYGTPGALCEGDTAFFCNPNNPTGEAVPREVVLGFAGRVRAAGGLPVVDEAFIDCCPEHSVRKEAADGAAVVVGSLTKALCVPGVRLGYLVAPPDAIGRLARLIPPWSLNAFAAAIARELPDHLDELAADRRVNAARREALSTSLAALGAKVWPSQANFVLADFGRPMAAAIAVLRAERILVRECASFGLGGGCLRLAVRTEEDNARLVAALERNLYR